MSIYDQIVIKIVKEQESLMGPVAWYQAAKVKGLTIIDRVKGNVLITEGADGKTVVDGLINEYGNLFGRAARQSCRESVIALIADLAPSEVPSSLQ